MDGKISAVVFDMDGVIFDTERLCIEAWRVIADREGLEGIEEVCYMCIGRNSRETERIVREHYGSGLDYDRLRHEVDHTVTAMLKSGGMPLKKGVREILGMLEKRQMPVALASSTRSDIVKAELGSEGLDKYFKVIVGGEMVSKSKPAPDIYLEACRRLGTPPENAAAVEDSFNGIRSAHSAGMRTVMVPDILQPDNELLPLCGIVCADLLEARDALEKMIG